MIVILFVLSGMCPVDHRNLFCLSLRLVIFRFRSWYAQDMAQSQSHQLSTLELELGWATRSTVSASISLCTWGIGACTALAGTQDMARIHGMHLYAPQIRHSQKSTFEEKGIQYCVHICSLSVA